MIVAVSTCRRPGGVSYLGETLASLDAAGAREHGRFIVSDGPPPDVCPDGWRVLADPSGPHGSTSNLWAALRLAHTEGPSRLLFVEDDTVWCTNAVRAAAALEVPADVAFVALFHAAHGLLRDPQSGRNERDGLDVQPFQGPIYCFNQALVLPARTVAYLVRRDPNELPANERLWGPHGEVGNASDRVLGAFCFASPWPRYGVVQPNFVQHIGAQTAVEPRARNASDRTAQIRSRTFRGLNYDALTWRP